MSWYIVENRYVLEKFREVRPRHRDYLLALAEQGRVAVAGPMADNTGGLALFRADDLDDLHKMIDADPYYTEGAVAERTVREFIPVLGSWVPSAD